MVFVHPHILWLLVLAPAVALLPPAARAGGWSLRSVMAAIFRGLAVAAAVVALARPAIGWRQAPPHRVDVIDVSDSVSAEGIARLDAVRNDADRLVVFGTRALHVEKNDQRSADQLRADAGRGGSNLADALRLAGSLTSAGGEIRLHSDGLQSEGDALAEVWRLGSRGIRVRTEVASPATTRPVLIESVLMPAASPIGSAVSLSVAYAVPRPSRVRFDVRDADGATFASITGDAAGSDVLELPVPIRRPGVNRFTVMASTGTGDAHATSVTYATPPIRVGVIETHADHRAATALRQLLGAAAEVRSLDAAAVMDADLLVVADVAADSLPDAAQQALLDAVRLGRGLLVTGGTQSLGPGGYAGTALAEILPVSMPQDLEKMDPSTTLVIIIDTSGSMGGPRISLAKEIARLSLRRLQPHDKVGIVEFYGSKRWAAPIQPASNSMDLNRALNRLTAGGGTVILPAMEEAFYALKNVNTRTRHVLVLTDGGVESGAFEPLVRKMSDNGMTVSTILVGPGGHSAFLSNLAQWGRGRFYHAPDRFNLPEILLKQTQTQLMPPIVERPVAIRFNPSDALVGRIDFAAAPPVGGYVRTSPRRGADVPLSVGAGDPLLAHWRFGRGRVAVLTTALGSTWTADLANWPQTATLMSNLCRHLASRPDDELRIATSLRPAGLEIDLSWPGGSSSPSLRIEVRDESDRVVRQAVAQPVAAARWNVLMANLPPGVLRIAATAIDADAAGSAAVFIPAPAEQLAYEADTQLLAEIDRISAQQVARATVPQRPRRWVEAWLGFAMAAMVLMLAGVLARRWPMRGSARVAAFALVVMALSQAAWADAPATQPMDTEKLRPAAIADTLRQELVARGSVRHVLEELKRQVVDEPGLYPSLAAAALECGELAAARDALRAHVARQTDDVAARTRLGSVLEMLGDDAAAAECLSRAIQASTDGKLRWHLVQRLSILQFDAGKAEDAAALLRQHMADAVLPGDRISAGIIAATFGHYALAAEALGPSRDSPPPATSPVNGVETARRLLHPLLLGTCLMQSGQAAAARLEFERALTLADRLRDRRFILDRVIAAARAQGRLDELATRWMNDRQLSADLLPMLLMVLRELGRVDDVMRLQELAGRSDRHRQIILSPAFQREVIAAILEAGRIEQAATAYEALHEGEPENEEWLVALARLRLHRDDEPGADALLVEAVDNAKEPWRVRRLADAARSLGRIEVADRAAVAWARREPAALVDATLYRATLARERGDIAAAGRLLRSAIPAAGQDRRKVLAVADTAESMGNRELAMQLLRDLVATDPTEDVLQRLAWLLEHEQRLGEAREIWMKLWRESGNASRKSQARARLLDLTARTGAIADLAIELEDQLAAGKAGADELSLLVEIYAGANDPASAAEVLHTFRDQAGGEAAMLRQLAQLYQRCQRFGQANQTLWKLVEKDPASAIDALQQIAVLALERGRPGDAVAALTQIAQRLRSEETADELRAGVLDYLGQYAEAAGEYRKALAAKPGLVEEWLLWAAAMASAGQKEQAIARLRVLADDADAEDLFIAAVDGMLNLEAPRPVLRVAMRRAVQRLAGAPEKVVLYHVAAETAEASADAPTALRIQELCLLVAGEQRTTLLREAMTLARSAGRVDRTIELGATMLALGEEVPPQVFLELGQLLLKQSRLDDAQRAFDRAREAGDADSISRQVAALYESAGYLDPAARELRLLIRLQPTDVPLRVRAGGLLEKLGRFDAAYDQYMASLDLLLRRQPQRREAALATSPTGPGRRPAAGTSLTEQDLFFDQAVDGLLAVARSDAAQRRLLDELERVVRQEMAALPPASGDDVLGDYARLWHASRSRRGRTRAPPPPQIEGQRDRDLAARLPADNSLAEVLVAERLAWGLYDSASALASELRVVAPPQLQLRSPTTLPAAGDAGAASQWITRLILLGRTDEAAAAVKSLPVQVLRDPANVIPGLLAACVVLDQPAVASAWTDAWLGWLEARLGQRPVAADVASAVRAAWPALSVEAQQRLPLRLAQMAERAEGAERASLAMQALRMSLGMNVVLPGQSRYVELAAASPLAGVLVELIELVPSGEAQALIRRAVEAQPELRRRMFILELCAKLRKPVDGPTAEMLSRAFAAAPMPHAGDDRFTQLSQFSWHNTDHCGDLPVRLAATLLDELADDVGVQVLCAAAYRACAKQLDADRLATRAHASLASLRQIGRNEARMLELTARTPSPAAARSLLWNTPAPDVALNTPGPWLGQAVVHRRLGQRDAYVAALRRGFALNPTGADVRRMLVEALEEDGRLVEMVQVFTPFAGDDAVFKPYERTKVMRACLQLGDYETARKLVGSESDIVESLQRLQIEVESGRPGDALHTMRALLIDGRRDRRTFTPFVLLLPQEGGMSEYLDKQSGRRPMRTSGPALLAGQPGALEEYRAFLRACIPGGRDSVGLVGGLVAAAAQADLRRDLLGALTETAAGKAMHSIDRMVLAGLLGEAPADVPDALLAHVDDVLLDVSTTDAALLEPVARGLLRRGQPQRAAAIGRWLLASELTVFRRSRSTDEAEGRMSLAVADLPESQRPAAVARWLRAAGPVAGDTGDDWSEAARLLGLLGAGGRADVAAALDLYARFGRIPADDAPRLTMLWARMAALAGDKDAFVQRLAPLLADSWTRLSAQVIDLRPALPDGQAGEAYAHLAVDAVADACRRGDLSPAAGTRAVALVGQWAAAGDLKQAAMYAFDVATKLDANPGEHFLWLADLARLVGAAEKAQGFEASLKQRNQLPRARQRVGT